VKKRSEELFEEFERRLRLEVVDFNHAKPHSRPATPVARVVAKATQATAAASPALPCAAPRVDSTAPVASRPSCIGLVLLWPRMGISVVVGIAVAHGAVALGQSPWWWLVAPLLGVAAGLGRRGD
jgi:hypothetical protein